MVNGALRPGGTFIAMRRFLIPSLILALCTAAYLVWPLWTAWAIREAIKSGDSAYLADKLQWDSVKATLKPSLAVLMLNVPEADSDAPPPGLWQRFKASYGKGAVDRFVDSYVTPQGLPQLASYGKAYRERVKGQRDESHLLPLSERIVGAWARLKRAEFISLTRFELEMTDKFVPHRQYAGVLKVQGLGLKLTELRVRSDVREGVVDSLDIAAGGLE